MLATAIDRCNALVMAVRYLTKSLGGRGESDQQTVGDAGVLHFLPTTTTGDPPRTDMLGAEAAGTFDFKCSSALIAAE